MSKACTGVRAGDEVRVFDRSGRSMREYPGEVVKVGRTLVTIRFRNGEALYGEAQFRMDTGLINDRWGGVWFKTPEEVDRDDPR